MEKAKLYLSRKVQELLNWSPHLIFSSRADTANGMTKSYTLMPTSCNVYMKAKITFMHDAFFFWYEQQV